MQGSMKVVSAFACLVAACSGGGGGGGGASGSSANAFVGTWVYTSESGLYTCPETSGPISASAGAEATITASGAGISTDSPCDLDLSVSGNEASVDPGSSCVDSDGTSITVVSYTLTLSSDGSTIQESAHTQLKDCDYDYSITMTR